MALILFLCSLLPCAQDCEQRLLDAERFQSALHYVLPCPHDAHDDATEQVEYAQWCVWAHCDRFGADDRAMTLGQIAAMRIGQLIR